MWYLTSQLRDLLLLWSIAFCRPSRSRSGQSLIESALVIAVIAVVCIPVVHMLREGFVAAYLVHNQALGVPTATAVATAVH